MRASQAGSYEIRVINFRCARSTFVGWAHLARSDVELTFHVDGASQSVLFCLGGDK